MSDRIVLITGSSGALGSAVVERFRQAGDTVVGVSRSGRDGVAADLSNAGAAAAAIDGILQKHGQIDVLVHVMGGFAGGQTLENTTDDTWKQMLDINLNSAFYVFRAVLPAMKVAGRGRLIAVSSRASVQPGANLSAYNVSKAGLNALVQTIAAEVRNHRITANILLPSIIDTEVNRAGASAEEIAKWVQPRAIADLAFWLASESAADINGALVPIYGRA